MERSKSEPHVACEILEHGQSPLITERLHRLRLQIKMQLALGAADQVDGADAAHVLQALLQHLVRPVGEFDGGEWVFSLRRIGQHRAEGFFVGLHALHLSKHFWRSHVSVSFPRIRPADGGFAPLNPVSDPDFVQLICALRLLLPDAGLVLSTRESARLRDHLIPIGITQMSAGSCTAPGGYAEADDSGKQFVIDDDRSHVEVAAMIARQGYEPVWKDWDVAFAK